MVILMSLLQQKDTEQGQQRQKTWGKSQGNQAQASGSLLPVESHIMCLIP